MRSPRDYRQTVITAVNMDGDSDFVGCIAGPSAARSMALWPFQSHGDRLWKSDTS